MKSRSQRNIGRRRQRILRIFAGTQPATLREMAKLSGCSSVLVDRNSFQKFIWDQQALHGARAAKGRKE